MEIIVVTTDVPHLMTLFSNYWKSLKVLFDKDDKFFDYKDIFIIFSQTDIMLKSETHHCKLQLAASKKFLWNMNNQHWTLLNLLWMTTPSSMAASWFKYNT